LRQLTLTAFVWTLSFGMLAQGQTKQQRIPDLHGTTFADVDISLPGALRGGPGVLVLGFTQASKEQVAGWGRRLAPGGPAPVAGVAFEMPMLASVPRLLRGYVAGRIKSDLPRSIWPSFLPVTDHEADWKRLAGFADSHPDDAYLLLVDETGTVRWRTAGTATDAIYTELRRRAADLAATTPASPARP
jgi:hypothetical protein